MWELGLISRDFPERRRAIYEDIDRKDGPMWSQVYTICLDMVKSLESRVDGYGKKPTPVAAAPVAQAREEKQRVSAPPKDEPIFVSTPPKKSFRDEVEKAVGRAATEPGQVSRLSPLAKKAMAEAKGTFLALQRETTRSDNVSSSLQSFAKKALELPIFGSLFRQDFNTRLLAAILWTPYGEPSLYINAAVSLSLLSAHSLTEDKFGNVQRDIPSIIRTFTSVVKKLEGFKAAFPMHWTDVTSARQSPGIDEILDVLKDGLGQLISEFGPYSRELRLSMTDMRLAREAAGVPEPADKQSEMQQIG